MAFRKVVPQAVQGPIMENVTKILQDFSKAWEGNDICPFQYEYKDGHLIVKDGDSEYVLIMGVINNHG